MVVIIKSEEMEGKPASSKKGLVILLLTAFVLGFYLMQRMGCGPVKERTEERLIE